MAKVLEVSHDIPGIEESEQVLSFSKFFSGSMARVGTCLPWPTAIASPCAYFSNVGKE